MRHSCKLHWVTMAWVMSIVAIPQLGFADQPATTNTPLIRDVALADDGKLTGQVIDSSGTPQANAKITIQRFGQLVQQIIADKNGVFAVDNLRGGVYQISTENSTCIYRAWAPNTAPPSAGEYALVLTDQPVVRGQLITGDGFLANLLGNPFTWLGIAGATVGAALAFSS